jgi:hypothetical protein
MLLQALPSKGKVVPMLNKALCNEHVEVVDVQINVFLRH